MAWWTDTAKCCCWCSRRRSLPILTIPLRARRSGVRALVAVILVACQVVWEVQAAFQVHCHGPLIIFVSCRYQSLAPPHSPRLDMSRPSPPQAQRLGTLHRPRRLSLRLRAQAQARRSCFVRYRRYRSPKKQYALGWTCFNARRVLHLVLSLWSSALIGVVTCHLYDLAQPSRRSRRPPLAPCPRARPRRRRLVAHGARRACAVGMSWLPMRSH